MAVESLKVRRDGTYWLLVQKECVAKETVLHLLPLFFFLNAASGGNLAYQIECLLTGPEAMRTNNHELYLHKSEPKSTVLFLYQLSWVFCYNNGKLMYSTRDMTNTSDLRIKVYINKCNLNDFRRNSPCSV